MTDFTNMEAHPDFPHLPRKCTTKPDPKCSACPLVGSAGHKSAASFAPNQAAEKSERFNAFWLARLQHGVWRRNIDAEGMIAAPGFPGYTDNGRDTINYTYLQSYNVTGASGKLLTLQTDGYDAREFTRNEYRAPSPDDMTGLVKIVYKTTGSIQPLAMMRFSSNSKLHNVFPIVYKITEASESQITLECDKDVSDALSKLDPEDSAAITVDVYQYASPENWQFVSHPDYFYGVRKQVVLELTDVPADGIYTLSDTLPVMHPNGLDPLTPTWVLEGFKDDAWENAAQANDRLFVTPTSAKAALKTSKPDGAFESLNLSDDLTSNYSSFRITYYVYNDGTSSECEVVGYARCRYSLPDYSGSMGEGYTEAGCGTGYYCAKRLMDNFTLTDEHGANSGDPPDGIRETATHYYTSPSGVEQFPTHGRCLQHGMCSQFQGAEGILDRRSPWQQSIHGGNAVRELVGACNHRRFQPVPTIPTHQLERILHPSMGLLAGYISPTTPAGIHEQAYAMYGNAAWAQWTVETDEDGNESIVILPGPYQTSLNTDGLFPVAIDGFKVVRDKINAAGTTEQAELDYINCGIERDTGELVGPGMAFGSRSLPPQDLLFAPNVDSQLLDTAQSCALGSFTRHSDSSDAELRVLPLKQESKPYQDYGTRTVHSISVSGTTVTIELENETHSWGEPKPLFSEDDVFSWKAGGSWPICPPAGAEIVNYYEPNKSTGSRLRGARRGDAIRTEDGHVLAISSVTAFGGSEASSWEGITPSDRYSADLAYHSYSPKKRDIVVVQDDLQGTAAGLTAGDTITFVRAQMVMLPGATLQWTPQGSDDWQDLPEATHYYGEGLWLIPDSWFAGKPQHVCFRAASMQWMDHRGIYTAGVLNRLQDMLDALDTWNGYFTSSVWVDPISVNAYASQIAQEDGTFSDVYYSEDPVSGPNSIGGGWSSPPNPPYCSCEGNAAIHVDGQAFGLPEVLTRTNATVVEAWAEVSCATLTKTVTTWELVPNSPGPGYHWNSITTTTHATEGFAVLGASGTVSNPGWTAIGSITGGSEGIKVVEVTALVQSMVSSGCHSFMLVPSELAFAVGGSLEDVVKGMLDPKPTRAGEVDVNGDGIITTGNFDGDNETNVIDSGSGWNVTFGGISFGKVVVKLAYPEEEKARHLLMPMWPSMEPSV